MSDIVTVRVYISTNRVGSECSDTIEFDRQAWESMSEHDKEDACRDTAFNCMEWGWEVLP